MLANDLFAVAKLAYSRLSVEFSSLWRRPNKPHLQYSAAAVVFDRRAGVHKVLRHCASVHSHRSHFVLCLDQAQCMSDPCYCVAVLPG